MNDIPEYYKYKDNSDELARMKVHTTELESEIDKLKLKYLSRPKHIKNSLSRLRLKLKDKRVKLEASEDQVRSLKKSSKLKDKDIIFYKDRYEKLLKKYYKAI